MLSAESGRKPQLRDHRSQIGRAVGDTLHLPRPNYRNRRLAASWILDHSVFPREMQGSYREAFTRARDLRKEGFGGVAYIPHPDRSGPVHAWAAFMSEGDGMNEVAVSVPLARHQEVPGIRQVCHFLGLEIDLVSTRNTRRRFSEKKKAGKDVKVPTLEDMMHDREVYLARTAETLGMAGVVFLAPSGEREVPQGPFKYNPMQMIVDAALEQGNDRVYFIPMGIGEKDLDEYEIGGMRWFRTAGIRIDECLTLREVLDEVDEQNRVLSESGAQTRPATVDTVLYEHLLKVLPDGLKPKP